MTTHNEDNIHGSNTFLRRFQDYLSEFVYGSIDGAITTFAVVAGGVGANLDSSVILIMGFANLFADGFSMSIGAYLAAKSEQENYNKHKKIEYWEIENLPEVEKEEVREIYRNKGFEGDLLEQIVTVITADKDRWVNTMMKDELEMIESKKSPLSVGFVTLISFLLLGFVPLLVYVWDFASKLEVNLVGVASVLTISSFAIIGYLRGLVNQQNKVKSIIETLLMGVVAALVAYFVGDFIEHIVRK